MRLMTVCAGLALLGCAEPEAPETGASDDRPFYQTLETPPAPILSPAEALEAFAIAPGYRIELAVAEPLLEDPVAADWDEDARLYVAEMRAYMPNVDGDGEDAPIGTVVRLTDVDGDGVFDEREVLLDGLVLPRAVRIVNEGLLIAEMGKLWLCPSASGWSRDIDCGGKRYLGAYGEHQGSVEHAENGLLVGLDNWLYSAKSARRLRLVEGALVEEPTAFRGQWGITQDDTGRLFYNTNSNLLLGDYYDAQAIVAAGNRKAPGLNARVSPDNEVFSVRVNPGVNRAYLPGVLRDDGRLRNATSASGMVVYRGGRFAANEPDVFVAEPAANVVAAMRLVEDGLSVRAERRLYPDETWGQRDFLASTDERFRPVDVLNGPDGALYVVDFYRGIIQDHIYLSEQLKTQARERGLDRPLGMGRLWRLVPIDGGATKDIPDWSALDADALVSYLSADDVWRRATAQRLLLRIEAEGLEDRLIGLITEGDVRSGLHALWILEGRDALSRDIVRAALRRDPRLAEAALLAGGDLLPVEDLLAVMNDADSSARGALYALAALRFHLGEDKALSAIQEALLAPEADGHVGAFALAALRGVEADFIRRLVADGRWTEAREQKGGVLGRLAQQYFRAEQAGAAALLDFVTETADLWVRQAVLNGLFETTREPGFVRASLERPHAIFSTTDATIWPAVARARRGFTWPGDTLVADAKPLTPRQTELMSRGETFYASSCANCHGADGAGVGDMGPPLADSPWVTEAPERLARIVLHGLQGPIEVAGKTWNSAMPGHKDFPGFDDEVASGLLTYLRRSWGHSGRAIDPEFIAAVRADSPERTALWTVAELETLAINTHFAKYAGRYGRPNAPMAVTYDGRALMLDAGIFSGPLVETREDHFLFEPRQIKLEFVIADDGSVPAVRMDGGEGAVELPRVP